MEEVLEELIQKILERKREEAEWRKPIEKQLVRRFFRGKATAYDQVVILLRDKKKRLKAKKVTP